MLFKVYVVCGVLQEFLVGNEELVKIYHERLEDAGYVNFKLAWTNNHGDGLLTAVLFNDFGDRLAQLLHVELIVPFSQCLNSDIRQEILIANTHFCSRIIRVLRDSTSVRVIVSKRE